MKCPKCHKEVASGAVSHGCGWRAVAVRDRVAGAAVVPATPERAVAAIEAVRVMLTGGTRTGGRRRAQVPLLSDVGHGGECSCEVCYAKRARNRWLRERFPVVE